MAAASPLPPLADVKAWHSAIHKYELEYGSEIFDKIKQNKTTRPEHLLDFVHERRKKESRSKFSTLMSNISTLGQRFERFHAALDVLAQGIPFGCILWGSIRVVLEIVGGYAKAFERLLKALEMTGKRLPVIELYSEAYSDSPLFQGCLIDYYISMIGFWSKAVKFYERKRCFAFWRSIWSSYQIDFNDLDENMKGNYSHIEQCTKALHELETKTQHEGIQALTRRADDDKLRRVIKWLTPHGYDIDYFEQDLARERNKRHRTSCKWILVTREFKTWDSCSAESPESLLWITAVPGAGKTILSTFLIDHLRSVSSGGTTPVLFIMFQAEDVAKSTPLSAARTLTYQLLDGLNPNNAALVEALAQRSSRSGSSEARDFRSLWELFCENVCKLQTAIIVVDAIDECQDGPVFIDSILKLSKAPHIKVLITGRREANLLSHLENHQSLNFGVRENHQDIFHFLSTEISNSRKLSDPVLSKHFLERFKMSLCDYLLQRANGLFIWASLVLKELESQITVEDILRTVDELPQELVDIYNLILRNIPAPERKLCTSILRWLACAVRPLSVAELWEVLSIEMAGGYEDFLVSEREIEISCGSLVVMENGFMHLVHHSLAGFLCNPSREPQSSSRPLGFTIDVSNANLTMLTSCLTYIDASVTDLNVEPKTQRERPCSDYLKGCYSFLEYAVYNWAHHLQNIETLGDANIDSRILWGDRWLYWIEFWFALGAQDLWSLERYVEALSNRCQSWDSVGPNGRASLRSTFNWTQHAARLLELYGQALQEDPSSIHFIDTDLGGQRLSTTASCKAGSASTPSPRTRHIRLRSTSFSEELLGGRLNESLSRSRLELPRYGHRLLGLFYADVSRGVIFMASYETVVPELLCQDMQTGRTMRPMRQGRTSITGTRYSYEGFSISKGRKYIATLHRSYLDETYYPRHRYQLTVWDIPERLALCGPQQDEWCSIAVSMSFESRFLGQCSQPLAFDDEDTLYCLSGRIDIRSAILGNSTFDESILQRSDFGKLQDLRGLGYSADCQSLVVYHGFNKWLARLNINDMSTISLKTFSASNAMVYSINYRGRYVVWQDTMASRHYCVHGFCHAIIKIVARISADCVSS